MAIGMLCPRCVHLNRGSDGIPKCMAFPAGIPEKILTGKHDHRKPFAGDNGIRFEPLPGERSPFQEGNE